MKGGSIYLFIIYLWVLAISLNYNHIVVNASLDYRRSTSFINAQEEEYYSSKRQQPEEEITSSTSTSSSSDEFNIYQHLATKTPYWIQPDKTSPSPPGTCELVKMDFVARHGSRMPVQSAIGKLSNLIEAIAPYKNIINEPYRSWITNWTVPYPTNEAGYLIVQGELEHYEIAKRMLDRFPTMFEQSYLPYYYNSSSTYVSRTGISASAFLFGIFEGKGGLGLNSYQPVFTWMSSPDQDYLLRFFDTCQQYQVDQETNQYDYDSLYTQLIYPNISLNIAKRLGVQDIWDITPEYVGIIFSACAYEISINNITDQWCSVVDSNDIEAWEFAQDISVYWDKGYGYEENYKISSILLQDIIGYFDQYIVDPNNYNNTNVLRFAHAETLVPLISLLGLFKDPFKLTGDLTPEQIANRQFRTSIISPYAANLNFLFYDCGDQDYKIRVDHNELAILLPGCDDIYCDYNIFKNLYQEALNFNWDSSCNINTKTVTPMARSDKEWKVLLGVFVPFSLLTGLMIGLFVSKIFSRFNNSNHSYRPLNGGSSSGLVYN